MLTSPTAPRQSTRPPACATFVLPSDASRPSFAALVNGALSAVDEATYAAGQAPSAEEDSDSWLDVDEADVDVIMRERSGAANTDGTDAMQVDATSAPAPQSSEQQDPAVEAAADRLQRLAKKVEKFVESKGDMEGALFDECVSSARYSPLSRFSMISNHCHLTLIQRAALRRWKWRRERYSVLGRR